MTKTRKAAQDFLAEKPFLFFTFDNCDAKSASFFFVLIMQDYKYSQTLEVRYNDLDTMRHVNNAIYHTYIEHARSGYLQVACQWDWNTLGMVLAKTDINYRRPIHIQNKPTVWIRTKKLGMSSITQEVVIMEKDRPDIVYADATVILVHIDHKTGRPLPIPDYMRTRIKAYENTRVEG